MLSPSEPPPPFNPLDIDWDVYLDAESIAGSDNDPVSTWNNQGTEADFGATGTARPTLKIISGQKVVRFDGTTDSLVAASTIPAWATWTCYIVVKDAATDSAYFLDVGSVGNFAIIRGFAATKWEYYSTPRTEIGTISTVNFHIVKCTVGTTENFAWKIGGTGTWEGDVKLIAAKEGTLTAGESSDFETYLLTRL